MLKVFTSEEHRATTGLAFVSGFHHGTGLYFDSLKKNSKVLFILRKSTLSFLPSFLLRLYLDGELS